MSKLPISTEDIKRTPPNEEPRLINENASAKMAMLTTWPALAFGCNCKMTFVSQPNIGFDCRTVYNQPVIPVKRWGA